MQNPPADRYDLQGRYLDLTRKELPAAATEAGDWPIRFDHCFMRIVLDHVFEGCWYEHLNRRQRAYKQLDEAQLSAAVGHGEAMLRGGKAVVEEMNRRSLAWRGKR